MKRNSKLASNFSVANGMVSSKKPFKLYIPEVFKKYDLFTQGDDILCAGSFLMLFDNDEYLLSNIPGVLTIYPESFTKVDFKGTPCFEFNMPKGKVFNELAIKTADVAAIFINIFVFHSNHPWWLTDLDLYKLLCGCTKYSGIGVDSSPEILELLIALASRTVKDDSILYKNGDKGTKLQWVPLYDVNYLYSTFAKITNNYQNAGMVSAVISKTNKPSPIEAAIRK
jgi:hypothetical protein